MQNTHFYVINKEVSIIRGNACCLLCVKHAILTDINHLPISVFFLERLCCPNIFYLFILCHVSLMLVCLSEFWVLCFVYLIGILSKNCVGVPQFRPGLILSISFMAFGSLGQQKYCETVYSRSGINHMWILKTLQIFWITLNQDLSLRYPPSKLLIFQLYIPPYRMTN